MSDSVSRKYRPGIWTVIFLALTMIAFMNFTRFVANELAEGGSARFRYHFIMETTGAYSLLFLLPFMLILFKRLPLKVENLHTRIPLHLLASMSFGASHTVLMYLSRCLIYRLGNLGTYDYGLVGYRFLMEYTHQFFAYWIIFGIFIFIQKIQESQMQQLKTAQLQQQLTQARMKALQMQLNPHFLFNTLNMISTTVYENPKAADKMIADLSDLLRITLKRGKKGEHSLKEELEITEFYVAIMKARFEDKLVVKWNIDPKTLQAKVPVFILQPLVENSIQHCIENLIMTKIEISSRKQNDRMILTITDNGPGLPGNSDKFYNNGMGLSNTIERLKTLYGSAHHFQLRNIDTGGLEVTLDIPFHSSGET